KVGANNFVQSQNSGVPQFGVPGAGGRGELVSGALEMSNVDLSEEFTEMIVAQRGFQANTRIITTSDEILQELVNLKR
ncbi:MAG: flagellar hook-basal body complex protein, partial [Exiguobacterium sp.]|nr:flagellar hook-basal body complex protein [Exiguobacterium sp.]